MAGPSVDVTISAITKGLGPSKRLIRLTPQKPIVPIGRSSKSPNKGLVCAMDNAWFDSHVMSREHAELYLSLENEQVMIRDDKSMHGTIVNGEKLERFKPRRLTSGDLVTFGALVRRGLETHPACDFQIFYEFEEALPTKITPNQSSTYKFPEDYDDEDDQYSENDLEDSDYQGSSDRVSCESPENPKVSTCIGIIEVQSPYSPASTNISMSTAKNPTLESMAKIGKDGDDAVNIDDSSNDSNSNEDESAPLLVCGSEPESDKESLFNGRPSHTYKPCRTYKPSHTYEFDCLSESEVDERVKFEPRQEKLWLRSGEVKRFKDAGFPSGGLNGRFEDGIVVIDSDDDGSSLDLDQDYPDEQDGEYDEFDEIPPESEFRSNGAQTTTPPAKKEEDKVSGESAMKVSQNIQPYLLNNTKDVTTAEAIARTADKALFFQAREENRAALERSSPGFPQSRKFACQGPDLYDPASVNLPPIRDPMLGIWVKPKDDEFDTTSAATYHNSKTAARSKPWVLDLAGLPELTKTNNLKRKAAQLEEDDGQIMNGPARLPQVTPAASNPAATETVVEAINTKHAPSTVEVTAVVESSPVELPATDMSETTTTTSTSASVPTVIVPQSGRPTKRLRTFAQTVGIAALGGVIAGAGLFGALVVSAPQFV